MKPAKFILIFCLMIPLISSAQNLQRLKADSLSKQTLHSGIWLRDSLKIDLPAGVENGKSSVIDPKTYFPNRNLAFALPKMNSKSNSKREMPVYNPNFKSNMPVMKPDSSTHFYLRIAKIQKTPRF